MPKAQLCELYAHGLGAIEDARVEFGPGFNVITGETGAGKTLLLGALELCLGADGANSRQRTSNDLRTSAVFRQRDGSEVVLSRDMVASGRLRSTLNGAASSADALRVVAADLIVIHGQHDSLTLRSRVEVLKIVDASGGVITKDLDDARRRLHEARALRTQFGGSRIQRQQDLDLVDFSINELESANIESSEELAQSLQELTRLTELRDGQAALAEVLESLDSDGDEGVLTSFAKVINRLPTGTAYDSLREVFLGALHQAREGARDLASLGDPDAFDQRKFDALNDRVTILQKIARKYGGSLTIVLAKLEELRRHRDDYQDASARVESLDRQITELEGRECELAHRVRRDREVAAERLTEAVRLQLPRVALANAALRFDVDGDDGSQIQILFTPNPGGPEGSLQSLASGGELSRILLALSLEMAHQDVVAVFDEVDSGVGGQVAQQIGECLREVAASQQVLAVTHLASVAAKADHHFLIEKVFLHGVTSATVRPLTGDERVSEIARMLAGDVMIKESRALAIRLLETSR